MRISSKDLIRNFGEISDVALKEPIVITKNGRDRLVLLSIASYESLQGDPLLPDLEENGRMQTPHRPKEHS